MNNDKKTRTNGGEGITDTACFSDLLDCTLSDLLVTFDAFEACLSLFAITHIYDLGKVVVQNVRLRRCHVKRY